jgi:teichuronic acid biosynthesis glycosyltransferase TuaC
MLKVAAITAYFPSNHQPWAGHSAYQTLRFIAQRCELKVFYPEVSYPKRLAPRHHVSTPHDSDYQPADTAVQYIPYPALPVLSRPLNGWQAGRCLLPHVKQFQPDVILAYVVYPDGFAALRIGRQLKVPVIITAIGSDLNRISDPLCAILTRRVLRRAALVYTVSADLLKTARKMGAHVAQSQSILNGCDTSVFYPRNAEQSRQALNIRTEGPVLLYAGRLDVRKGLCQLIEAAALLRPQWKNLRCYIVGEGSDRPLLVDAIKLWNAQHYITLVPPCSTQEVALWMAAADLLALPSYAEGCPNVVLEALASGRPVVASKVGGIPEIMDESVGRLVPPGDVPSLTLALDEVLAQKWDPHDISARYGRSWSDVADDLEGSFAKVLSKKS